VLLAVLLAQCHSLTVSPPAAAAAAAAWKGLLCQSCLRQLSLVVVVLLLVQHQHAGYSPRVHQSKAGQCSASCQAGLSVTQTLLLDLPKLATQSDTA
jgi:hypothetical protein